MLLPERQGQNLALAVLFVPNFSTAADRTGRIDSASAEADASLSREGKLALVEPEIPQPFSGGARRFLRSPTKGLVPRPERH